MVILNNIKEKIKEYMGYIIAILTAAIAFLLYFISLKNRKIAALETKLISIKTIQEAEKLEIEIQDLKSNTKINDRIIQDLDNLEIKLKDKKEQIIKDLLSKTPAEIENYWKNN